jgi:outer membrane protein TolC
MSPRRWVVATALCGVVTIARAEATTEELDRLVAAAQAHDPELDARRWTTRATAADAVAGRRALTPRLTLGLTSTVDRPDVAAGALYQLRASDRAAVYAAVTTQTLTGARLELRAELPFERTTASLDLGAGRRASETRGLAPATQVRVQLPLWGGAGDLARLPGHRDRLATELAIVDEAERATAVAAAVRERYWQAVAAMAITALREQSLELARTHLRRAEFLVAAGVHGDDAAARAAVARGEDDLLRARAEQATALAELAALTGLPDVAPTLRPPPPPPPPSREAAWARVLAANPRLRRLRLDADRRAVDRALEVARARPRLELDVTARIGGDAPHLERAVAELTGATAARIQAELVFTTDLDRRGERATRTAAAAARAASDAAEAALQRALRLEVDAAIDALTLAAARAPILAQAEAATAQALAAEDARFDAGVATSTDVLAKQHELTEARWRTWVVAIDAARASVQLAALTGER